jgi:methylmalonyl-CoA mutase
MQENKINKLFSDFPEVSTEAWNEKLKKDLKTDDIERKLNWKTGEGIELKGVYRSEDLDNIEILNNQIASAPFLRGTKEDNNWAINRIIETSDIAEANKLALKAISRGATSVEFNCSQIKKADSLAILLDGINLEEITVRFDKPMSYKIILKHLISFIENKGFDKNKVQASFNWDAMAYRLISGKYYQTLDDNINELKSLIEEAEENIPNLKILSVNGLLFHNGGSTTVQELAFSLSAAVEYTSRLMEKGLSLETIVKHLYFRMAIGSAYFMEIAKFRALRQLWNKTITAFDSKMEDKAKAYIFATNGIWNKSIYDPYVNMLRTTTETMSAAIAGVDVISVLPFDKVYKNENDFSSRIAQNQQILIKEEAHFDKVVDAAGGSYYIENITNSLMENSWELFNTIEDMGGYAAAMESNFIKTEIEKSAEIKELALATGKLNMLGTSQFPNQEELLKDELELEVNKDNNENGLNLGRLSKDFDKLRLETENSNYQPKVLLLAFGNITMRKARAAFMTNFFACAGYEITEISNCESAKEAVKQIEINKYDIVSLCSSDDEYISFARAYQTEIATTEKRPILLVAGNPKEAIAELKQIGIEDFIHIRTNIIESLNGFQERILRNKNN